MNKGCDCGRRRLAVHHGCRHAGLEVRTKERDCAYCGAPFFRKQRGAGIDVARFCSRKCSDASLREAGAVQRALRAETERLTRLRPCTECGTPFVGRTNAVACSSECTRRLRNRKESAASLAKRQSRRPAIATCKHCKKTFTRRRVKHDQNRYCGEACARKAKNRNKYECDKRRGAVKGAHVTRAKSFGVEYDHSVTPARVFDRAGWRCQICCTETPRELKGTNHPNAPELDHVVPMAAGGGHVWSNVQCACRRCNGHKAARVPTEQERALWASRASQRGITGENFGQRHDPTTGPESDFFVCTSSREITAQIR